MFFFNPRKSRKFLTFSDGLTKYVTPPSVIVLPVACNKWLVSCVVFLDFMLYFGFVILCYGSKQRRDIKSEMRFFVVTPYFRKYHSAYPDDRVSPAVNPEHFCYFEIFCFVVIVNVECV